MDSVLREVQGSKLRSKPGRSRRAKKHWEWNPLKEGSWHPDFAVNSVTVADAKQAVQEAEAKRAAERGSGSADEADPIQTGAIIMPALALQSPVCMHRLFSQHSPTSLRCFGAKTHQNA